MDLPKCRSCGERHRAGPCPQFQVPGASAPSNDLNEKSLEDLLVQVNAPFPLQPTHRIGAPAKAPFDRKAYQREYMRGYRKRIAKEQPS
jgi:hypothetical protein